MTGGGGFVMAVPVSSMCLRQGNKIARPLPSEQSGRDVPVAGTGTL